MIDSHCHLADEAFADDAAGVIGRAQAAGVDCALCILDVTNRDEQRRADHVAQLWPEIQFSAGVHPHQAGQFDTDLDGVVQTVEAALDCRPSMVAVGEVGLDYHYRFAPPATQVEVFRRQIFLARKRNVPLVVHTREADNETVDAIRVEGHGEVKGVFHCFTGDIALARRALDLGFYVSFSGIVTFKRAEDVRRAAKFVPADRLLVETDSPYLAPVPHRGKRNEPAWVAKVIDVLADIRNEDRFQVADFTHRSFDCLFDRLDLKPNAPKGLQH